MADEPNRREHKQQQPPSSESQQKARNLVVAQASIFAVRTTAGQEKNAAELVATKAQAGKLPVLSIVVPENLRGYIFVEAPGPHVTDEAITGIKHVRSRVPGKVSYQDIEKYLITKPVIDELEVGTIVEITGGPFKGMRARITRVNKVKREATLELLEATFTLPITVNADYLKVVEKGEAPTTATASEAPSGEKRE
ncbi:transcription elongation factor Spt5 [Candidatus Bathyarchaeota archaeon]|nr:transcription elongation factor Spt5 [Candidatus Bathyarchaeota archaeon]